MRAVRFFMARVQPDFIMHEGKTNRPVFQANSDPGANTTVPGSAITSLREAFRSVHRQSHVFDFGVVRYFRISRAQIMQRQFVHVVFAGQPGEIAQLPGADAQVILESPGRQVDI